MKEQEEHEKKVKEKEVKEQKAPQEEHQSQQPQPVAAVKTRRGERHNRNEVHRYPGSEPPLSPHAFSFLSATQAAEAAAPVIY